MTQKVLVIISVIVFSFAFTFAPAPEITNSIPSEAPIETVSTDEKIIEKLSIEEEISLLYTAFSEKIPACLHLPVSVME